MMPRLSLRAAPAAPTQTRYEDLMRRLCQTFTAALTAATLGLGLAAPAEARLSITLGSPVVEPR